LTPFQAPHSVFEPTVVEVTGLHSRLGGRVIHDNLNMEVRRGEVLGVVGPSGAGKSVLLDTILGLRRARRGTIRVLGHSINRAMPLARSEMNHRCGVLFQNGALFSSLTVRQNIAAPLIEHTDLPREVVDDLVGIKITMVGLPLRAGALKPAQLSGGMRKRAALARALALDPELLFLDEPTAGLDPAGAADFDALIRDLRKQLDLTVFMITHDLASLAAITDRIVFIDAKTVVAVGTVDELTHSPIESVRTYFHESRGFAQQQRSI